MINFRMLKASDKFLWIASAILVTLGLMFIFSCTFAVEAAAGRDAFFYVKRQFGAMIVGLFCMAFAMYFDVHHLKKIAPILYVIMIVLLLAADFLGTSSQGAQRWLSFGPITFQPSEFAKLITIISLATYFDFGKERSPILPGLLIVLIPFALVFKQPDLGTALVILAICLGMIIWSRITPSLLFMILTPFLSLIFCQTLWLWVVYLFVLWGVLYFSRFPLIDILLIMGINIGVGIVFPIFWGMLKEYQKLRLVAFLNPGLDPFGAGYHTLQSKIAIGAGGLFGAGFMHGTQTQLQFIPVQHSDFIFSAIGEEFGLIGTVMVLSLLVLIVFKAIRIADATDDYFAGILALGIAMMLGFHTFVNIGMTLGLLPVVGIPLPFISYGGTALIVSLTCIGLLQNIAMRNHKILF